VEHHERDDVRADFDSVVRIVRGEREVSVLIATGAKPRDLLPLLQVLGIIQEDEERGAGLVRRLAVNRDLALELGDLDPMGSRIFLKVSVNKSPSLARGVS